MQQLPEGLAGTHLPHRGLRNRRGADAGQPPGPPRLCAPLGRSDGPAAAAAGRGPEPGEPLMSHHNWTGWDEATYWLSLIGACLLMIALGLLTIAFVTHLIAEAT